MITKNWYKIITTLMFGGVGATWSADILDITGVSKTHYFNPGNTLFFSAYQLDNMLAKVLTGYDTGVVFGTGNTPATLDDYKLSGDVITTLSGTCAISRGVDAEGAYITARYTLNNNGDSDVTVSEIAACTFFWPDKTKTLFTILDRTVLDTPVTIPADGVGKVEYTIRLTYPTATADAGGTN